MNNRDKRLANIIHIFSETEMNERLTSAINVHTALQQISCTEADRARGRAMANILTTLEEWTEFQKQQTAFDLEEVKE